MRPFLRKQRPLEFSNRLLGFYSLLGFDIVAEQEVLIADIEPAV